MAQISTGGFIVLPGGYGTYEEMMEMITWNQVGFDAVIPIKSRLTPRAAGDPSPTHHRSEQ